jgi:hypothetical protein
MPGDDRSATYPDGVSAVGDLLQSYVDAPIAREMLGWYLLKDESRLRGEAEFAVDVAKRLGLAGELDRARIELPRARQEMFVGAGGADGVCVAVRSRTRAYWSRTVGMGSAS